MWLFIDHATFHEGHVLQGADIGRGVAGHGDDCDSFSTWSFHSVSLYGCKKICECASISPGSIVIPGKSIVCASAGAWTSAGGPTARIFPPCTNTSQPACVCSLRAPNTLSALSSHA